MHGIMVASKEKEDESMNWLKRHDLAVFLVLAFALSWFVWPFVLLDPESAPMIPYGPFIAVFIVLALTRGWAGVRDLLASMVRWRVGLQWYAVALFLPVAIVLVALYLVALFGGPSPTAADFAGWYGLPLLFLITTLIKGAFTEEPGWRGFLLPRLQSNYSPLVASLIVGVIWASWHLPLLLSDPTGQRPALQFFVLVLAQSVVLTWVYNGTRGSVLLVILMHGAFNSFASFLVPGVFGSFGSASYGLFWWLMAALWWVVALAVIAVIGMARDRVPSMETPAMARPARVQ
jgi:membrane protease YdiL (CAAX protease family)